SCCRPPWWPSPAPRPCACRAAARCPPPTPAARRASPSAPAPSRAPRPAPPAPRPPPRSGRTPAAQASARAARGRGPAPTTAARHHGGRLVLGPDGHLWIGTGDAFEPTNAAVEDSLNGKVLRITSDGEVPADNPGGSPIFSSGHRNVQGIAFGPDGTAYASEL